MLSKDPNARLDFSVDWSLWLPAGDTIATSEWELLTPGVQLDEESTGPHITTVWVAGGEEGKTYHLLNRVTTAAGRTDDRTVRILVRSR